MTVSKGAGLDFEQPILALDQKIAEIKTFAVEHGLDFESELAKLSKKREQLLAKTQQKMSAWNYSMAAFVIRLQRCFYSSSWVGLNSERRHFYGTW